MSFKFNTERDLVDAYGNGFVGAIYDPQDYEDLMSTLPMPYFGQVAEHLRGSGKGKLSLPYMAVRELSPVEPYLEKQTTGDCYSYTSKVRMADGSIKKIGEIEIGEYVISAFGNKKRVYNTIKKPYKGSFVELTPKGYCFPIASTPDHKYIVKNDSGWEWKAAKDISTEDFVLLSSISHVENEKTFDMADYCPVSFIDENTDFKKLRLEPVGPGKIRAKNGRNTINKNVKLDEKLAWLVGLYAAEGGIDGENGNERITYNLGSHEMHFAEKVRDYFRDVFDVDVKIYQVPSKPTVIYVRIYSVIIANFFKYLCQGNVYSKGLGKEWFVAPKSVKHALFKGWIDGDGHYAKSTTSGTSVSKKLVRDLVDIATSIGINAKISVIPYWEDSTSKHQESYVCYLDSHSSSILLPQKQIKVSLSDKNICNLGRFVQIKEVKEIEYTEDYVYCISVEDDNSFICEGYGVHNCVSHGTRNAVDISRAVQILNGSSESFEALGATEGIYGSRGHGGQGMSCSQATRFVTQQAGVILRKSYGKWDFTTYNASTGSSWGGRGGVPEELMEIAKKNQVQTGSVVDTIEEVIDALANGYGVSCCSGQGFSSTRDEKGFARAQGSWSHCMCICGVDDTGESDSEPAFVIVNSWGPRWISGPKPRFWVPDGAFLARASVVASMIRGGGTFAYSNVVGFPPQNLPDYGSDTYL